MTDDYTPPIPGTPESNDLVVRGPDGDPLPDPRAIVMLERESYERIIEGLKIAADAAMHLAAQELENMSAWLRLAAKLDQVRRAAVQVAGIDSPSKQRETERLRGNALPWRDARGRFREGIKQAAGGMRQLATCFRMELLWLRMARDLEQMQTKMLARAIRKTRSSLILPR
jgi:hypothetical protein